MLLSEDNWRTQTSFNWLRMGS